ncbi:MAG: hypothetical protein KJP23_00375 [Deltaproteobacteria bacterium]|nr:hypothetical protein [Deltaproteobacteria bacterium]
MDRSRCSILQAIFVLFVLALLCAGCAMVPVPTRSAHFGETGPLGSCADFFASLDKRTEEAEVIDPGVFRVKNYPYLRVNRLLASFREEVDDQVAFAVWVNRMQALDQDARKYEILNLPNSAVAALDSVNDRAGLYRKIATCGDILKAADFQSVKHQERLRRSVSVPDDYIALHRFLGIYPFTSMFVYRGVSIWHAEAKKSFSPEPPVDWRSIRYIPARKTDISSVHQTGEPTKRDALGIPMHSPADRKALFQRYAPVWEIQLQGDYDRIGTPIWTGKGVLDVNTDQPLTYTLLSFTRFGKEILTQLNYIIWFPSRPKEGNLDIYGGLLDGLNYRVTLDTNKEPLIYETIHNCGCYYKTYPTNRIQVREKIDYAEPPLILKAPDVNPSRDLMTVSMQSRTHYVQHLYPSSRELQSETAVYSLADYGQHLSLPLSRDDRKSMFSQNSITPGSERLERFILWPTGVLSPGAMRRWGRHAVAFVGKRHFDDPFFMDSMFMDN